VDGASQCARAKEGKNTTPVLLNHQSYELYATPFNHTAPHTLTHQPTHMSH
jgi:hypothetical protein